MEDRKRPRLASSPVGGPVPNQGLPSASAGFLLNAFDGLGGAAPAGSPLALRRPNASMASSPVGGAAAPNQQALLSAGFLLNGLMGAGGAAPPGSPLALRRPNASMASSPVGGPAPNQGLFLLNAFDGLGGAAPPGSPLAPHQPNASMASSPANLLGGLGPPAIGGVGAGLDIGLLNNLLNQAPQEAPAAAAANAASPVAFVVNVRPDEQPAGYNVSIRWAGGGEVELLSARRLAKEVMNDIPIGNVEAYSWVRSLSYSSLSASVTMAMPSHNGASLVTDKAGNEVSSVTLTWQQAGHFRNSVNSSVFPLSSRVRAMRGQIDRDQYQQFFTLFERTGGTDTQLVVARSKEIAKICKVDGGLVRMTGNATEVVFKCKGNNKTYVAKVYADAHGAEGFTAAGIMDGALLCPERFIPNDLIPNMGNSGGCLSLKAVKQIREENPRRVNEAAVAPIAEPHLLNLDEVTSIFVPTIQEKIYEWGVEFAMGRAGEAMGQRERGIDERVLSYLRHPWGWELPSDADLEEYFAFMERPTSP